jgi:hypothetical protein
MLPTPISLFNKKISFIWENGMGQKTTSQNEYASSLLSFFSRINNDYAGKYYLSATFRRDGTSRFEGKIAGVTFIPCPLDGTLTKSGFLKMFPGLQNLKVRAGYGAIGNQEIGLYAIATHFALFRLSLRNLPNTGYAQTRFRKRRP